MFGVLSARVGHRLGSMVERAGAVLRAAWRPKNVVGGLVADVTRSRSELVAENALLRQQLIVAARAVKRPVVHAHERGLVVALASLLTRWREALLVVKPETVLRWHREGFRLFWKRRSVMPTAERCRVDSDVVTLVRRMAAENRTWGAERIRGELLKLGIRLSKRTIQRQLRDVRPPGDGQRWRTFLRNHTAWACDFLQVYDICFRPLFAFFIVDTNTRCVVHVAVTRAPTEQWTAQQLRNATPFGAGPQVIIRDRDTKFGPEFDRAAKGIGVRVIKTAVRAPDMNAVCERFLGSVRRECLDHLLILGEGHLRSVLHEYVRFFNKRRPHQGLGQRAPTSQMGRSCSRGGKIVAIPVLGGLHNDYQRAA